MRHCAIADFGTALDCVAEDLDGFQLPYRARGPPRHVQTSGPLSPSDI